MKIVKLYQWRGVGSLSLPLTIDGKRREIEFPTGTEKPRVHARFETDDENIQSKIEANALFKIGHIKLVSSKNIQEPSDTVEKKAPAAEKPKGKASKKEDVNPNSFPAITGYQQAAALLIEKFGATESEVQNPDDIVAKAAEVGAEFPNLID